MTKPHFDKDSILVWLRIAVATLTIIALIGGVIFWLASELAFRDNLRSKTESLENRVQALEEWRYATEAKYYDWPRAD